MGRRVEYAIEEIGSKKQQIPINKQPCACHTSKQFYSQNANAESLGSRLAEDIPRKKTCDYHALAQYRKAIGQCQEMQDNFFTLGRDRNRQVFETVKWPNVRNGYKFINCNDTH